MNVMLQHANSCLDENIIIAFRAINAGCWPLKNSVDGQAYKEKGAKTLSKISDS